jgi:hypothetical protein
MTKAKLSIDRLARLFGILVGVAVAVVALTSWRVPGGERTLGTDVRIEALQTGEIGVAPLHPFVSAPSLLPGSSVAGDVTVRNQTGVPLALRVRALPSVRDLDRLLVVRVSAGSRTLYDGSLGGLRAAGTQPLTLRGATAQRLHVSASLPAGVRRGFQGRIVDVSLQIATQRVR